ncbi:VacJ family lipoprotein [Paraglaciecola sp. 20A4]|uniref:MlaA family lipoprotein n=1 Tax=Paraglaciecola sp. 20A4 TaxID=2687288 RepID=UPI00197D1CE0|nr:VacJ family lipoprotein [Paraglaciecola sp. 20A4]
MPITPILNKIFVSSIFCATLFLSACSSNTTPQPIPKAETTNSVGSELVVKSSHGTQTIEPTVISYVAPNSEQTTKNDTQLAFDDPLEFINRPIFAFNDKLFEYILIPAANGYTKVVPDPVRTSVGHFFGNIREPLNALNQLFQGDIADSGKSVGRFLINSTIGLLGFFDPATAWFEINENVSTINDTLVNYDVGYGSYLVLPILGQSDLRNGFSTITESIFNPIQYATENPQTLYIQSYGGFHAFAPQAPTYEKLRSETDDPYVFFRNLYMQSMLRDQQFPVEDTGNKLEQQDTKKVGLQQGENEHNVDDDASASQPE